MKRKEVREIQEDKKTLKTFNLDSKLYREFSAHCKKHGISMSKRIENFIRDEIGKIRLVELNVKTSDKIDKSKEFKNLNKDLKSEEHPIGKYC